MEIKEILFDNHLFGLLYTIFFFVLFGRLFENIKNPIFSPLIFSIASLIAIIYFLNIPIEYYNKGGDMIAFFLGPTTVALAVPLYKKFNLLKKHLLPIMGGVFIGSFTAIVSVVLIGRIFNLDDIILLSLTPKATTTAIATELSKNIGGNPSLTLAFVIVAGFTGYVIGEKILKLIKTKHSTAKGIALGTASHAFGTNRALEMGEEEGAMSSLAIGLAGLITGLLLPIVLALLNLS